MVGAGMNRKLVIFFYFSLASPTQPELSQYHNFDPDPSHSSASSRRFPEQISAFSASKLCKTWSCGSGFFFLPGRCQGYTICVLPLTVYLKCATCSWLYLLLSSGALGFSPLRLFCLLRGEFVINLFEG